MNLVLSQGYLGYPNAGKIQYFNGVREDLEARYPVTIIEPFVDPLKGVVVRGGQLARQIRVALGEAEPGSHAERAVAGRFDQTQPVHIIAHSMGSLDSRYVLSPANPDNLGSRVVTLTTIAGPHRGSPTVDLLFKDIEGIGASAFERRLAKYLRKFLTLFHVSLQGLANLTTEWTAEFNRTYVDHPDVRYFSVAGSGRPGRLKTAAVMDWSWRYIKEQTGEENDGAVPVSSARWGELDPDFWPADHPEEIGHDVNRCGLAPKDFDYLARYRTLVERLLRP